MSCGDALPSQNYLWEYVILYSKKKKCLKEMPKKGSGLEGSSTIKVWFYANLLRVQMLESDKLLAEK